MGGVTDDVTADAPGAPMISDTNSVTITALVGMLTTIATDSAASPGALLDRPLRAMIRECEWREEGP